MRSFFLLLLDGVLGREANVLIKCLAKKIAYAWEKSLSEVTGWSGPGWLLPFSEQPIYANEAAGKNGDLGLV